MHLRSWLVAREVKLVHQQRVQLIVDVDAVGSESDPLGHA